MFFRLNLRHFISFIFSDYDALADCCPASDDTKSDVKVGSITRNRDSLATQGKMYCHFDDYFASPFSYDPKPGVSVSCCLTL